MTEVSNAEIANSKEWALTDHECPHCEHETMVLVDCLGNEYQEWCPSCDWQISLERD